MPMGFQSVMQLHYICSGIIIIINNPWIYMSMELEASKISPPPHLNVWYIFFVACW